MNRDSCTIKVAACECIEPGRPNGNAGNDSHTIAYRKLQDPQDGVEKGGRPCVDFGTSLSGREY